MQRCWGGGGGGCEAVGQRTCAGTRERVPDLRKLKKYMALHRRPRRSQATELACSGLKKQNQIEHHARPGRASASVPQCAGLTGTVRQNAFAVEYQPMMCSVTPAWFTIQVITHSFVPGHKALVLRFATCITKHHHVVQHGKAVSQAAHNCIPPPAYITLALLRSPAKSRRALQRDLLNFYHPPKPTRRPRRETQP